MAVTSSEAPEPLSARNCEAYSKGVLGPYTPAPLSQVSGGRFPEANYLSKIGMETSKDAIDSCHTVSEGMGAGTVHAGTVKGHGYVALVVYRYQAALAFKGY